MPVGLFPVTGITANPNRLQYSSANVACPSSLPPKADRHGGLSPLTIGGLFRPDHRVFGLHSRRLLLWLEGPIDVVPQRTVLLLVVATDIISPSGRLHEQNEAMIGNRNILQPRLPLVRIPGILLQHCFHLVDSLRAFLLKHLISDGTREHMTRNVPGRSGKRQYGNREKYKRCD